MAPRCTICAHPERTAIETAIAGNAPLRAIARQYDTSKDALSRHRDNCGALAVADARQAADEPRQRTVRERIEELERHTAAILVAAEQAGDLKTALLAVRTTRDNLALVAKLSGELDERPQVNILLHPDWLLLRERVLGALQHHPAALEAVIDALGEPGS